MLAGACEPESQFLAEIWIDDYFLLPVNKPKTELLTALAERISDWRYERRGFAYIIRGSRMAQISAGYRGIPASAPVILNGVEF